jgi:hypothetical protein
MKKQCRDHYHEECRCGSRPWKCDPIRGASSSSYIRRALTAGKRATVKRYPPIFSPGGFFDPHYRVFRLQGKVQQTGVRLTGIAPAQLLRTACLQCPSACRP